MDIAALKNEIGTLSCETAYVEFKSVTEAGLNDARFKVQLVRTIVAMHNSGGGAIVFGLDSAGRHAGGDLDSIRKHDPIKVSDLVRSYTGRPLPDVRREEFEKNGNCYPGWVIPPGTVPLPFTRPGEVSTGVGKPDKLFHPGQIYVRKGASCVPADVSDLTAMFERVRNEARKEFAGQIGQLAVIPEGHAIQVLPQGALVSTQADPGTFRITTDPAAPAARLLDPFTTHPNRQKDVVNKLVTRVRAPHHPTSHDVQCIRKVHASEIKSKGFMFSPPHSSPYYADGFVDWIVEHAERDPGFFEATRAAARNAEPDSRHPEGVRRAPLQGAGR